MRKKIRIMCLALILILNLTMVNAYASSTYDRDAIKSVQSILNMWGYDCGTPDGVQGKNTTEAIKQYQKDQEMTETGEVTQTLIDTMLSGIPLTTLNKRYNEAVDYWNELKDQAGISTLNYSNFTSEETNYCINNNIDIVRGAVSYTHLDVYKRQEKRIQRQKNRHADCKVCHICYCAYNYRFYQYNICGR